MLKEKTSAELVEDAQRSQPVSLQKGKVNKEKNIAGGYPGRRTGLSQKKCSGSPGTSQI